MNGLNTSQRLQWASNTPAKWIKVGCKNTSIITMNGDTGSNDSSSDRRNIPELARLLNVKQRTTNKLLGADETV
jgi:hypothetical protein